MDHRGLLLLHSTGTGKTLTAAATAACLVKAGIVENVVVLLKKSALSQFREEVIKFWPKAALSGHFVYATASTFFRLSRRRNPASTFLIVDEAHEFSNVHAEGTKRLVFYALKCKRVLLLTATPYVNSPYDLAPIMAMIKGEPVLGPKAFSNLLADKLRFRNWIAETTSVERFDKSKSPDFAKITLHDVSVPMAPSTWQVYQTKARASRKKPFYMDLRELSMGVDVCEKCDWIEDHVRKWMAQGEGKVVIYTSFLDHGVRMIEKALTKAGASYAVIDGSKSGGYRHEVVTLFNKPPRTKEEIKVKRAKHEDMTKLVKEIECGAGKKVQGICAGQIWFERRAEPKRGIRASRALRQDDYDYVYFQNGHRVTSQEKLKAFEKHIETSPIPPAWSPAFVCKPNPKMLWAAKDKKGRWQRRYSDLWNDQQEFIKVMRLKRLTSAFWSSFHEVVSKDMGAAKWTLRKMAATATALMEACHFRPGWTKAKGNEKAEKAGDRPHYGVSTLLKNHVKPEKDGVAIDFLGKSGKQNHCFVSLKSHPLLVKNLTALAKGPKKLGLWKMDEVTMSASALQDYLKEREIRAKDFRTYFANYTLVELLRSYAYKDGKRPDEVNLAKRKRALGEVYRTVSKGLNNTPAIAKKAYIFTGLWVLYLVDPVMFMEEVDGYKGKSTANLLTRLVRLFEEEQLDWRELLKELKGEGASTRNMEVILITDAGAESMDLKGVRHIILSDPTWTDALRQQIIGRGQRYKAHAHLPPSKRHIDVWELFLDPPKSATPRSAKSADRLIGEFSSRKRTEQELLYGEFAKVSVTK